MRVISTDETHTRRKPCQAARAPYGLRQNQDSCSERDGAKMLRIRFMYIVCLLGKGGGMVGVV